MVRSGCSDQTFRVRSVVFVSLAAIAAALMGGCGGQQAGTSASSNDVAKTAARAPGAAMGSAASGGHTKTASAAATRFKTAPDFKLRTAEGTPVALSDLKGKVVLMDFWATWCAPCVQELPGLQKLNAEYASRGLVVVGMTISSPAADVKRMKAAKGLKYPLLMADDKIVAAYAGVPPPKTLLIDRSGHIIDTVVGAPEAGPVKYWAPRIEKALSAA